MHICHLSLFLLLVVAVPSGYDVSRETAVGGQEAFWDSNLAVTHACVGVVPGYLDVRSSVL